MPKRHYSAKEARHLVFRDLQMNLYIRTSITAYLQQRACQSMNTHILLDICRPMRSKENILLPTDISLVKDLANEKNPALSFATHPLNLS